MAQDKKADQLSTTFPSLNSWENLFLDLEDHIGKSMTSTSHDLDLSSSLIL